MIASAIIFCLILQKEQVYGENIQTGSHGSDH